MKLARHGGAVTLDPGAGMVIDGKPVDAPVTRRNDAEKIGPTVVQMGSVRFQVIKRFEKYGLRVKDANATRAHTSRVWTTTRPIRSGASRHGTAVPA